jgi:hypothetical protein
MSLLASDDRQKSGKENEVPIYRATIRGSKDSRIVRADTAAQARNHIVDVEQLPKAGGHNTRHNLRMMT